jgi:hypothetical protein
MSKKMKLFIPCYYAFFANGMMALVLGSVTWIVIMIGRLVTMKKLQAGNHN